MVILAELAAPWRFDEFFRDFKFRRKKLTRYPAADSSVEVGVRVHAPLARRANVPAECRGPGALGRDRSGNGQAPRRAGASASRSR